MAKIPKTKFEVAPEGTHNAICVRFVDMGTQKQTFKGEEKESRICRIYFDLVDEKTATGNNMCVFQKYTYSPSANGNLMKMLKGWLKIKSPDFDMDEVLGKPALVTITHSESGEYANITAVVDVPKNTKVRKSTETIYSLHLTPEDFDVDSFNELPSHLQGIIADSPEYLEATSAKKKAPKKKAAKK